jgi:hypothetical protein
LNQPDFTIGLVVDERKATEVDQILLSTELTIRDFLMTVNVVFEASNLVVIRGSGVLKRSEVDQAKRQIYGHILVHGKVHMLILLEPDFTSYEALVSWEDIEEDAVIQPNVVRIALVGDWRWREQALLFVMTAVAKFQIDYFKTEQEELARAWLM